MKPFKKVMEKNVSFVDDYRPSSHHFARLFKMKNELKEISEHFTCFDGERHVKFSLLVSIIYIVF